MNTPLVVYIGDRDSADFSGPVEWLERNSELSVFQRIDAACEKLAIANPPTLVVVAEDRPGAISSFLLEQLRRRGAADADRSADRQLVRRRSSNRQTVAGRGCASAYISSCRAWVLNLRGSDYMVRMVGRPPSRALMRIALLMEHLLHPAEAPATVLVLAKERETAAALCDALRSGGFIAENALARRVSQVATIDRSGRVGLSRRTRCLCRRFCTVRGANAGNSQDCHLRLSTRLGRKSRDRARCYGRVLQAVPDRRPDLAIAGVFGGVEISRHLPVDQNADSSSSSCGNSIRMISRFQSGSWIGQTSIRSGSSRRITSPASCALLPTTRFRPA